MTKASVAAPDAVVPAPVTDFVDFFGQFDFEHVEVTLEALLKAGVHFGHLKSRCHPKMAPFVFATRKNISILNLEETVQELTAAAHFLETIARSGKPILFVGIKKQTQDAVQSLARRIGMPFVIDRWLGGTLTNFTCIRDRAKFLKSTKEKLAQGEYKHYTKLERLRIEETVEKLEHKVGGIQDMVELPGVIVLADAKEAGLVIHEARRLGVPLVALTDSNADPSVIDYPIPGNDDALSSVRFVLAVLGRAVLKGKEQAAKAKVPAVPQAAAPQA